VTSVKVDAGKDVPMGVKWNTFTLVLEEVWYFEIEDYLGEVCVLSHGVRQVQYNHFVSRTNREDSRTRVAHTNMYTCWTYLSSLQKICLLMSVIILGHLEDSCCFAPFTDWKSSWSDEMFNLMLGFAHNSRKWIRELLVMTPHSAVDRGLQVVNQSYSAWFHFDIYL
jgi:hypothetical protein